MKTFIAESISARISYNEIDPKLQLVTLAEANERIKVLEDAAACGLSALKIASRQLTEDMKLVLNGKRWGGSDIDRLEKALGIKSSALEVNRE